MFAGVEWDVPGALRQAGIKPVKVKKNYASTEVRTWAAGNWLLLLENHIGAGNEFEIKKNFSDRR